MLNYIVSNNKFIWVANSNRRKKQKALDIRVIMGNPPYSAGQTSANDNNANVTYTILDESIRKSMLYTQTDIRDKVLLTETQR